MCAKLPSCFLLGLVVTLAACGAKRGTGDDGDDGDDTGMIDAPPPGPPDASCGGQIQPIKVTEQAPPDLLIVLDRSGSMTTGVPPTGQSRWEIMRAALNAVASDLEDAIRFGLIEFPSDENCAVGPAGLDVPIDIDQAAEIAAYFTSRFPGGATPAALGLQEALTYYNTIPVNTVGRYVLFATDGEPNCTGNPAVDTVSAVTALANAGISTFVLGFGGGFGSDQVLNDSALAGLVPKPGGPPHYYAANNQMELDLVLEEIAGGLAASCSYVLATPPPDPNNVAVTMNGVLVPRSSQHTHGWDYHPDANTITFFGVYCDQIMNGSVIEVSFAFGCPGPVVD